MLRCVQTSSPENFPAEMISAEMSVLERQRAMLQRLYLEQQQRINSSSNSSGGSTMPLFQCQNFMNSSSLPIHPSLDDNSQNNFGFACSEITTTTNVSANSSRDHHPAAGSTKKRKAEFEVEEEDKRAEGGEAGEVESGITGKNSRENSKASEVVQKTEYIHVRARRGQATDSHSLAERARREKISKKMKCLQDLVPGCNKVTGKAGMLDEIINYVQSLQKQVEFLSMKLAALNPRLDFNIDSFFAKEVPAYIAGFPTSAAPMEIVHSALLQYNQSGQQESNSSGLDLASNSTHQMLSQKAAASSMIFSEHLDSLSSLSQIHQMSTLDNDWQSLFSVGFH